MKILHFTDFHMIGVNTVCALAFQVVRPSIVLQNVVDAGAGTALSSAFIAVHELQGARAISVSIHRNGRFHGSHAAFVLLWVCRSAELCLLYGSKRRMTGRSLL